MEYKYEVPVVVKAFSDEDEVILPTRKSIVDFVIQHLRYSPWRDYFPDIVSSVKAEPRKDRLMIQIVNMEPYSPIDDDLFREYLEGWCKYGYFSGGLELMGRYHGYSRDGIVVFLADDKLPIVSKTKAMDSHE